MMFNWFRQSDALQHENASLKTELAEIKNASHDDTAPISDLDRMAEMFDIGPVGGVHVTPKTSMKVSIVFACVRLIAGAMAQMPIHAYGVDENGQRVRVKSTKTDLLNIQPTPTFSAAAFWEYITASMLLHGDGFAVILRDRNGVEQEYLPVSPTNVHVQNVSGRLNYFIVLDGRTRAFDQDDILHFPGFGFNGLRSMSVIKWGAMNSIGLEMAMEQYSQDFFESGAHQSIAVIKQGKWDAEDQQRFRESFVKTYGGSDKGKYPLTLDKTTDIKELSVNAKDSQLLESREFQITDIARAFGIPSFLVNQEQKTTSFGSGVSEIAVAFIRFSLMPHVMRFGQEMNRKLFMRSDEECEMITAGLMRGTLKERNESYRQALGGSQGPGYMTQNEVRALENLPKIDNPKYDELYDPRNAAITIPIPGE